MLVGFLTSCKASQTGCADRAPKTLFPIGLRVVFSGLQRPCGPQEVRPLEVVVAPLGGLLHLKLGAPLRARKEAALKQVLVGSANRAPKARPTKHDPGLERSQQLQQALVHGSILTREDPPMSHYPPMALLAGLLRLQMGALLRARE